MTEHLAILHKKHKTHPLITLSVPFLINVPILIIFSLTIRGALQIPGNAMALESLGWIPQLGEPDRLLPALGGLLAMANAEIMVKKTGAEMPSVSAGGSTEQAGDMTEEIKDMTEQARVTTGQARSDIERVTLPKLRKEKVDRTITRSPKAPKTKPSTDVKPGTTKRSISTSLPIHASSSSSSYPSDLRPPELKQPLSRKPKSLPISIISNTKPRSSAYVSGKTKSVPEEWMEDVDPKSTTTAQQSSLTDGILTRLQRIGAIALICLGPAVPSVSGFRELDTISSCF